MRTSLTILLASSALLAACTVGPDYHRPAPATPPPAQFKEMAGWTQAAPADAAPKGEWWKDFHDPLLDELEPQVRIANQTVQQYAANYQQAVALVKVANAALYPSVGVTASGPGSASSTKGGTQLVLEATASWTLDLWGKLRRQIEENRANAQASEATLANATLSAQVALANAVINLRAADADIDLLAQVVEANQSYLDVVSASVRSGYKLYGPSDEMQASAQLKQSQANLLNANIARAQYVHAIAVLAGRNPEDLDVAHNATLPTLPAIPVGVPSSLLQRRPDVAAAERTMAAQNAAVGATVAAWYPTVSLSGGVGTAASAFSGLFTAANSAWSGGVNIAETLLDFGARHGQVQAARAAYDAAVASYRATVLAALQNVEDDLVRLRTGEQQTDVIQAAVNDATRATEIARSQYQVGTANYATVDSARLTELSVRQTALSVAQNRLLAAVSLIGDLGGGWSASDLHDPRHESARK